MVEGHEVEDGCARARYAAAVGLCATDKDTQRTPSGTLRVSIQTWLIRYTGGRVDTTSEKGLCSPVTCCLCKQMR